MVSDIFFTNSTANVYRYNLKNNNKMFYILKKLFTSAFPAQFTFQEIILFLLFYLLARSEFASSMQIRITVSDYIQLFGHFGIVGHNGS